MAAPPGDQPQTIPGLDGIEVTSDGGLELGALVTLAQIAASRGAPPLPRAERRRPPCGDAPGAQRRHHGRQPVAAPPLLVLPQCALSPGRGRCNAAVVSGENQYHAIFDNQRSAMVQASTPATALVAYGAEVELNAAGGKRVVPVNEFLLPPDAAREATRPSRMVSC